MTDTPTTNSDDIASVVARLASVTEADAYATPWTFGELCKEAASLILSLQARLDAVEGQEAVAWLYRYKGSQNVTLGEGFARASSHTHVVPLYASPPSKNELQVQADEVARLTQEIGRLEDELVEAQYEPWPAWAAQAVAVIRKRSGYGGYDDASDGVDLPQELDDAFDEFESRAEAAEARATTAEKERERGDFYSARVDAVTALAEVLLKALEDIMYLTNYGPEGKSPPDELAAIAAGHAAIAAYRASMKEASNGVLHASSEGDHDR